MTLLLKYYSPGIEGGGIPDEVKIESSTGTKLGSYHNVHTLIARIIHTGEYMKINGNCKGNEREWGNLMYKSAKELLASYNKYSLASEELARLKEENERLRGEVDRLKAERKFTWDR